MPSNIGLSASSAMLPAIRSATLTKGRENLGFSGAGLFLLPYFETSSESLQLAASSDGINYVAFGKKIYGGPNNNLRDPSIIYHKGFFYLAYSPNSFGASQVLYIDKSRDGFNWTNHATVNFSSVGGAQLRIWSPDWFKDDDESISICVACNPDYSPVEDFSIYVIKATNDALTTWTAPVLVFTQVAAIDPFIIKENGTYYLWYKNESTKFEEVASCATLTGTYNRIKSGDWAGWGSGYEGASVIRRGPSDYVYYADRYATGGGIRYATSTSLLAGWSAMADINTNMVTNGDMRHGTPYMVTDFSAIQGVLSSILSAHCPFFRSTINDNSTFTLNGWRSIGSQSIESPKNDAVLIIQYIDRSGTGTKNKITFAVDGDLSGWWAGDAALGNELITFDLAAKSTNIPLLKWANGCIMQPNFSNSTLKIEPAVPVAGDVVPLRLQNFLNNGSTSVSLGFNPTNNDVNLAAISARRMGETVLGNTTIEFSSWGGGQLTKRFTIRGGATGGEVVIHNNANAIGTECTLGFRPDTLANDQSLGQMVCRRVTTLSGEVEFDFLGWNTSALSSLFKIKNNGNIVLPRATIPATSASAGEKGEIAFTTTHAYFCVAANSWRRVALATF